MRSSGNLHQEEGSVRRAYMRAVELNCLNQLRDGGVGPAEIALL
jgi:hypothetical protein